MCAWFEPGTGVPQVVHAFGDTSVLALREPSRWHPSARQGEGRDPRDWTPALQSRLVETYAIDLLPEEAVRSLFARSSTVARPYFPSISVVPVPEAGDLGGQSGVDAFRSLLGWPKRRRPDYDE
jgi:hypothetical protein